MIRQAKIEDAADIADIHIDAWRVAYKGIIPNSYLQKLSTKIRADQWVKSLSDIDNRTFVKVNNNSKIIGWISFGVSRNNLSAEMAEIYAIYFHPDFWGKGYGKQLLKVAEKELEQKGFTEIMLWVLELNSRARIFYKKAGYAPDGSKQIVSFDDKKLTKLKYRKSFE